MRRVLALGAAAALMASSISSLAGPNGRQIAGPYAVTQGSGRAPCLQVVFASMLTTRFRTLDLDTETGQLDYHDELESPGFGVAPGVGSHYDSAGMTTADYFATGREIRRYDVTVDVSAFAWHTGIRSRDIDGLPPRNPAGKSSATLAFLVYGCGEGTRVVRMDPLVDSHVARTFHGEVNLGIDFAPGECLPSRPVSLGLVSSVDVKLAQWFPPYTDQGSGPDNGNTGVELHFNNPVFRAYEA